MIYLDYNATAPMRQNVLDQMISVMRDTGNPSSVHAAGRGAKRIVEEARSQVAALAGSRTRDVVFTASGTEANNMALRGCGADTLIISAGEHDSSLAAAKASGLKVHTINLDSNGLLDMAMLEDALQKAKSPTLVSVMTVNNETGVIQDVKAITHLVHTYGAKMHTDAVQAAGKIPIDLQDTGVDYLTLSAHKIGGPQGVGALVLAPTVPLNPVIMGGGQELGRRSGTENVAGIAGFGVAAMDAITSVLNTSAIQALRDRLEDQILMITDQTSFIGKNTQRAPNTSCIVMPYVKGETQVMHMDLAGICVSSGSACSSGKVKVSHVLSAMGQGQGSADCAIRVSLGYDSTMADVDAFVAAWNSLYQRAGKQHKDLGLGCTQ